MDLQKWANILFFPSPFLRLYVWCFAHYLREKCKSFAWSIMWHSLICQVENLFAHGRHSTSVRYRFWTLTRPRPSSRLAVAIPRSKYGTSFASMRPTTWKAVKELWGKFFSFGCLICHLMLPFFRRLLTAHRRNEVGSVNNFPSVACLFHELVLFDSQGSNVLHED